MMKGDLVLATIMVVMIGYLFYAIDVAWEQHRIDMAICVAANKELADPVSHCKAVLYTQRYNGGK